jgi:hypothetical protein
LALRGALPLIAPLTCDSGAIVRCSDWAKMGVETQVIAAAAKNSQ